MKWLRAVLAAVLATTTTGGAMTVHHLGGSDKVWVTAYFDNSNGLFAGDDVRILGVPVGRVARIEPQPTRAKVTFWVAREHPIPVDAKAVILSPQLVTGRAIQLTPVYTAGPVLESGAVIDRDRTAVPVEWDDLRIQLQRLTALLAPTQPGGVSTLGAVIDSAAENLRGQGANIRETVVKLSQVLSALGDHSADIFTTFTNLAALVSALHDSADLLERLNENMATVSTLVADDPGKVARTIEDLGAVIGDVETFADEHRDAIGTAAQTLASISGTLVDSLDDIEQTLHIAPGTVANFANIFEPANGSLTGALAVNNFADPVSFLCGAIQAAARLGAEQSAKLCVQYLAPIVKNRQYNFPPIGENLVVGAQARPNEVTYSEDWMRPGAIDPAGGLPALMVPDGGGVR
ncbi:MCE family protein [Mycolicibacterium sp.]|uniref:MCE family protein n=1 Tax=Mycolicibacterium sp. TaxID=2320850 RepID=UPI003D13E067